MRNKASESYLFAALAVLLVSVFVLLDLQTPAPMAPQAVQAAQVAQAVDLDAVRGAANRVALVEGSQGTGSAWPIANVGGATIWLTAGHVVLSCDAQSLLLADGRRLPILRQVAACTMETLRDGSGLDAGMLWTDGIVEALDVAQGRPAPLARVFSAGWPQGVALLLAEGFEAGSPVRQPREHGACTAMVAHGSSGGVILDEQGRAVGIIVQLWELVAVYIPTDAALPWVAEQLARG